MTAPTTSTTSATSHSSSIDALLQQYLALLDTYTSLRHSLSQTLSSIHQDLARANFSAPRGVRYGQDGYDARMRASRGCRVEPCDESPAGVRISIPDLSSAGDPKLESEGEDVAEAETREGGRLPDPLRMFGILVPPALREAKEGAGLLVGDLVPRIVQVDLEMREVEVRIRRARKRMGRAEREVERERAKVGEVC